MEDIHVHVITSYSIHYTKLYEFLTNHGDMVNLILRARNNHEKEYIVTVNHAITKDFIQKMGNGVPILDTVTRKCVVEQINRFDFKIILTQGLNRQIRRMCEYLGYEVKKLKRVRIMNIKLDVPVGQYRDLTTKELNELNRLIADSKKTYEPTLDIKPQPKPPVNSRPDKSTTTKRKTNTFRKR